MKTGSIFSRRKIWSNVFLTDVVPAPEEPVIAMMGCLIDILVGSVLRSLSAEETAFPEKRSALSGVAFAVVEADSFHLVLRAEDQGRSRVNGGRLDLEYAVKAVYRRAARLFDEERDRVRLV